MCTIRYASVRTDAWFAMVYGKPREELRNNYVVKGSSVARTHSAQLIYIC
jgi:hypothetical protein